MLDVGGISNQILAAYLDAPNLSWSPMHDLLTLGSLLHCCSLPEITVCRYIWLHVPKTFSNHFSSCSSLDVSRCILNARSTVWEKRFPPRVEIKRRNLLPKIKKLNARHVTKRWKRSICRAAICPFCSYYVMSILCATNYHHSLYSVPLKLHSLIFPHDHMKLLQVFEYHFLVPNSFYLCFQRWIFMLPNKIIWSRSSTSSTGHVQNAKHLWANGV